MAVDKITKVVEASVPPGGPSGLQVCPFEPSAVVCVAARPGFADKELPTRNGLLVKHSDSDHKSKHTFSIEFKEVT